MHALVKIDWNRTAAVAVPSPTFRAVPQQVANIQSRPRRRRVEIWMMRRAMVPPSSRSSRRFVVGHSLDGGQPVARPQRRRMAFTIWLMPLCMPR